MDAYLAGRSQGFLLIFDSLDRYEEKTIKALLQDSAVLSSLSCHVVYTMHINLMYRAERAYWDIYSRPPVVLPMLALRERNADWRMKVADSPYSEEAVNAMLVALNKRIRVELLFEVPEDARLLVKMSGGCLRDLLHLVNLARTKSRKDLNTPLTQITTEGVEKAIAEYRLTLTEGLEEADYQRLAALAQQKSQEDRLDEHIQRLLNKRVVLRYSRKGIRWTDIHPLVIETEGFQNACRSTKPQITSG